jgi:apolipoprotein N-acyltransferase
VRLPLALAATLGSSALFGLAFPPWSLRPLAFVCLVPLLLALRSGSAVRAVGLAWLWAVASAWAIAPFFATSLAAYYERPVWVGLLAGMAIFSVMASLYYMAFALIDRRLPRDSLAAPLLVAAAWTSIELARGRLFTGSSFLIGNPWGLLGYTHASGSLAQVASFAGVYGIGFAIAAVNAGLAGWIGARLDPSRPGRRAARAALLAALPAFVFALGGGLALRAAPAASEAEGLIEVGVVQGDVAVGRRWLSEYFGKNLDVYIDLTRRALREGSPRLIVWPESAVTFFLESEPLYRGAIARVLAAGDVELLAGGPARNGDGSSQFFNSVFTVSSRGAITARYDKEVLLPFSEYYPFRSLGLMRRRVDGVRTYSPGPADPAPLDTRMGRAGVLVCNEAMLPEVARARVRGGAELLVSPSNDSWIAGKGFAEHMLAVVGLRAIEQRRYLVRASTSGPSAVIDPWGRTAVRTPVGRPAVLLGGVRPRQELTAYARLGDAFAAGNALVVAAALLRSAIKVRRRAGGGAAGPA